MILPAPRVRDPGYRPTNPLPRQRRQALGSLLWGTCRALGVRFGRLGVGGSQGGRVPLCVRSCVLVLLQSDECASFRLAMSATTLEASAAGNTGTGTLFVRRVPAPLLRGLSSLAESRGLDRGEYVRRVLRAHFVAVAELEAAQAAGEREVAA